MPTYNIFYDYMSDYGEIERNCIDTVECTYSQLQDILRNMRQSDNYSNIWVVCVSDNED